MFNICSTHMKFDVFICWTHKIIRGCIRVWTQCVNCWKPSHHCNRDVFFFFFNHIFMLAEDIHTCLEKTFPPFDQNTYNKLLYLKRHLCFNIALIICIHSYLVSYYSMSMTQL